MRVGFQSFQHSALETLSDIIVRYIYSLGKTANLAGRVEANVFDVIQGLEELGSGLGYAGSSDVDRCVVSSGILGILFTLLVIRMISHWHMMFHDSRLLKEWKEMGSFWEKGKGPPGEHIPSWLPAFHDPEACAARWSAGNEMMSVSNGKKTELASIGRKVEQFSSNLHKSFACDVNEGGSSRDHGDAGRVRDASDSNPYLADPLHLGEKEVELSPVVLPANLSNEATLRNPVPENCVVKNHVSMLETFAPAIEAMKSGLFDSNNEQKKVLYNQRPLLHF